MLSELVITTAERSRIIEEMQDLGKSIYKPNADIDACIKSTTSQSLSELIFNRLSAEPSLQKVISQLTQELAARPVISITVASEPSISTLERVKQWVSSNVSNNAVVDIVVDPQVLAGAKVIFNGKYFDGSLEAKITQYLMKS